MNNKNEDSRDNFYSESNMKAIKESVKQLKEGKVVKKLLKELEDIDNVNEIIMTNNKK